MIRLSTAVNRILALEPKLKDQLLPLMDKWEKNPNKRTECWKELLNVLNTSDIQSNKEKIKTILLPPTHKKIRYTIEEVSGEDVIIGVLPENLADCARRYDRQTIQYTTQNIKNQMTGNFDPVLIRKIELLDIKKRRLWFNIKDYFNLREYQTSVSFNIKSKENLLVVTIQSINENNTNKFREFLRQFGLDLPPSPND